MEGTIRIKSITIENLKNVESGEVKLTKLIDDSGYVSSSNVLGIYGQNGSGKTSLVEAFKILKILLSEGRLSSESFNLISKNKEKANLKFEFFIFLNEVLNEVEYKFSLEKFSEGKVIVTNESLKCNTYPKKKGSKLKTLSIINSKDKEYSPKALKDLLTKDEESRIELRLLEKEVEDQSKSFIFSSGFKGKIADYLYCNFSKLEEFRKLNRILDELFIYSQANLVVIDNENFGPINANLLIPINFNFEEKKDSETTRTYGTLAIKLNAPTEALEVEYRLVKNVINQMNIVLNKIIPDLNIEIKEISKEFNAEGEKVIIFQLFSKKKDGGIPLKYESDGIKKIISILSTVIMAYNNPSYCAVIDELDAGIFEYLLGEILEIINKFGKGQLIFTSHNLRPLEVLNQENIIFTTTDREKNYTQMKDVKATNNMRKKYMRSVMLGVDKGQALYEDTDSYEIRKAFRKAGRGLNG